jgi:hypothetical protein
MEKTISRVCFLLCFVATLTTLSVAQLTKTTTRGYNGCSSPRPMNETTYSNWVYKDSSGVNHYFNGVDYVEVQEDYFQNIGGHEIELQCGESLTTSLDTYSTDGLYYLQATGATGTVTLEGVTGYVDPKYIVVGVTYAPPGPSTNTFVQYLNSTFFGSTESLSNSFTSSSTSSVSLTYGFNIPLVASGKITDTYSATNTVTTKTTSTVTSSIQIQQGEKTFGTGNYFAPVDHDYDQIWVWLNPVAIFTVAGNDVVWNGYGFDGTDQSEMDIVPIALGYLNGDFGAIPPDIQSSINRSWAANQIWPAGQGPALTSSDLANIAAADPFSVSTYGEDEIGYVPPSPQTADYRFTLSSCTGSASFNYLQADPSTSANIYTCQLTYTNLSMQAEDISTTYSQTFSVDDSFSGSGFLSSFSADLKESSTLTWTTDAQSSITTSTTSTGSLSVQGPPCNNVVQGEGPCVPVYDASGNEPTQFDVYQDNMFGTFMFAPIHYY